MGYLKFALGALVLVSGSPVVAGPVDRWAPYVAEASSRFQVPVQWIQRVISAESGGRLTLAGQPIASPAGAMGLMQLMPPTWLEMRDALALGANPHDPRDNILAGTLYLRKLYDRFGYPGLFAAYNAGPGRYAQHRASGRPLPLETRLYVAKVTGSQNPGAVRKPYPAPPALLPLRAGSPGLFVPAHPENLFVPLSGTASH